MNTLERTDNPPWEEVESQLCRILNIQPDAVETWYAIGRICTILGNTDAASECYHRVLTLRPDHREAQTSLKNMHKNRLQGTKALNRASNSSLEEAKSQLCLTLKIDPDAVDTWNTLGNISTILGNMDAAVDCYQRALALHPDHSVVHVNLGNIYFRQGRHKEAALHYQMALQNEPNHALAHCNLGNVNYALGKYDEAAANYQSAIQLEPNLFIAFYNLGNLRMLQEKYDKAVNNYRRAIQLGPSSDQISTIKEQGRHLIRIGRHPEAKALYAELSRSYPDDIEALIGLGKVNGMLGCMEEAAASCNRALALQPDNSEAHLILGNINFHNRRPDVALKYYQQALNSNPQNTVALNNFGKACLAVDQIGIYIENYRKTLPLLPDPSSARIIFSEIVKNLRPIQYDPWLDKELHSCFLTEGTDEKSLAQITTHLLILKYRLQSPNDSDGDAILETAENIAHDELFIALLRKTVNVNAIFEKLLRKIRYTVFANFNEEKDIAGIDIPIISALALQSLNNEYIIEVNEEEERRRRSLKASIELLAPTLSLPDKSLEDRILVYAMYDSLSSLSCKKHLCAVPLMAWSEPLRPLLEQALLNPLEEENIKRELPTIGRIEDQTSRLVQSQYEENPYPRWLSIPKKAPGTIKSTLMQLFPDFSPPAALDGPVKILVAGCGTGKHPIQIASHDNVEILAVDISKSSLAYAVRMARKYGIDNIQFMQGDILELADLDARFHIIESVGVLHHMKDPVAGWKILTKLLVKDGLMSIGLYSELARSSIVAARELIHHEIIAPSADNIRKFRQRVLRSGPGDILNELTNLSDFYSMSECRDLLFHYQEHRFTLPQINTILDDLSLSFIGFKFDSLKIENAYRNIFPQDKEMKNLLLWHQFETMHPNTFTRMYNFWCQARPL